MNEREDKYESQDEGEYHFSDESSYELEPEVEAEAETPKPAAPKEGAPSSTMVRYRRMGIAVTVFVVVLFVVYKLIIPASTPQAEFAEATASKTPKPAATASAPAAQPAPSEALAPVIPVSQPNPIAAPPPSAPTSLPANNNPFPAPQAPSMAVVPSTPSMPAPTVPAPQNMQPPMNQPTMATPPPSMPSPGMASDRLTNLEQQNAKLSNMMENEYTQKLADYQAQNIAMQAKIHELNTRLANIEATLNQLTQAILNKQMPSSSGPTSSMPPGGMPVGIIPPTIPGAKSAEPKMTYSVQAIIPGRAWLKAENGDTVTVAEGDILKDYGRITKIDPYDGIVEIDTGTKTITLSYGATGD